MKRIDMNIFNMVPQNMLQPARGRILIAEPFLRGPYFSRSVVLIVEHNAEGTVGFVLNKPSEAYPDELVEGILSFNGVLHIGGPVSYNTLHFLHTMGDLIPGAIKVTPTVYWGGDFETVKKLINSKVASSDSVKFFAGYSGWVPEQLDNEIKEYSWVVSTIDDRNIMQQGSPDSWHQTVSTLGENFKLWHNFPPNPSFN